MYLKQNLIINFTFSGIKILEIICNYKQQTNWQITLVLDGPFLKIHMNRHLFIMKMSQSKSSNDWYVILIVDWNMLISYWWYFNPYEHMASCFVSWHLLFTIIYYFCNSKVHTAMPNLGQIHISKVGFSTFGYVYLHQ